MRALVLGMAVGLVACTPTPKPDQQATSGGCGDSRVAKLVGQVWNETRRAETLKTSGARSLRVIAPGTVVTMDYRPDRLNIETDAAGRITRLNCG
ncbi:I78 family peptidase inhibitor [uncultured Sphingomonas sp.]|uniref:I78 family peptidase inhibitor n=1 Tax=uncultured Sphingomonas sp. TaxID=158754 RepID=UPI0025EA8A34|nr:I78 family peptidase inhibitor [uncultured Sphingomonas sp.]